jgi:hypothetical protein
MENIYLKKINFIRKENTSLFKNKSIFNTIKKYYNNRIDIFTKGLKKSEYLSNIKIEFLQEFINKHIIKHIYIKFLKRILKKELFLTYYKQYILFNSLKYKNTYITPLKKLISKIYKKNITFNIVNLKNYFLNSDILTQVITSKASNRNNKILRILRASLRKIKTPTYSKNLINREKKILEINNNLLLKDKVELNSNNDNINYIIQNMNQKQEISNIDNYIIDSMKNKVVSGIKLEASGRLTKRFTAQRSILKFKYKGTLKNIDTSYKGLSSKSLRNNVKSNIQYSKLGSKNRIGAFGIKG